MHGTIRCTRLTAKTLRENRRLLGLSIPALSKATGIPVQRLRWLEDGKVQFRSVSKAERESLRLVLRISGNGRRRKEATDEEWLARRDRFSARTTAIVARALLEHYDSLWEKQC